MDLIVARFGDIIPVYPVYDMGRVKGNTEMSLPVPAQSQANAGNGFPCNLPGVGIIQVSPASIEKTQKTQVVCDGRGPDLEIELIPVVP